VGGRQHRRLPRAANTLAPPLSLKTYAFWCYLSYYLPNGEYPSQTTGRTSQCHMGSHSVTPIPDKWVWGSVVSSPSWVRGWDPVETAFDAFRAEINKAGDDEFDILCVLQGRGLVLLGPCVRQWSLLRILLQNQQTLTVNCCFVGPYAAPDNECRSLQGGWGYWGSVSTTVNGRTCQSWSASSPHEPSAFVIDENFPDGSVAAAGNKCRNPEPGFNEGVWCYTTDPRVRWELCHVPMCPGNY